MKLYREKKSIETDRYYNNLNLDLDLMKET